MNVAEALETRRTCRAFTDEPVPRETVEAILKVAQRAPSGGNLQPWRVYATAGEVRDRIVATVREKARTQPRGEGAEYAIYPPELSEPYRTRRFQVGEQMYAKLGIPREDKAARLTWFARNYEFFGAPVALFFTMDRQMQEGQWSDLGMFLQSIALLAREHGLHTAFQEAWAVWTPTIVEILQIPANEMLFCAMGLGHEDRTHPLASFRSERAPLEELATFHGF
ncbi:MAG: nitroreductase [Pseudomonadales bacterium]|jgi:nitroreductase|nr:nitroreductase [Pseudomonadales bacterium]